MIHMSIFGALNAMMDDSSDELFPAMATFHQDFLSGKPQNRPYWNLMMDLLSILISHYGSFCGLLMLQEIFKYFQCCWIETKNFHGILGTKHYPSFMRRLNGLGASIGAFLFPASSFDEEAIFEPMIPVIAETEPITGNANDAISFYKDFHSESDQTSFVNSISACEGVSVPNDYATTVDMALQAC